VGVLRIRWFRSSILISIGIACFILDGAFFDLFPSIILYLALEYLWFESELSAVRMMIVLTLHSIACFGNIRIAYIVLLALYGSFLLWRDYFLKPFVPFIVYLVSLCFVWLIMGSHWIGVIVVTSIASLLWGVRIEKI